MIREVNFDPAGEVLDAPADGAQTSREPNSSGYPWAGTPTKTLGEVWSDDDATSFWYCWPHKDNASLALVIASFVPPPTLAIFKAVKLQAWWSLSQQGPNNWYFPLDNAYGPRARLALRNRAKDGYLYSSYREFIWPTDAEHDENVNNPASYTGPILQEWELAAHPEGGPWTMEDLSVANFAAGIEVSFASPAFTNQQGSFYKLRVHKLRAVLTIEDLGGYVKNVRHAGSMALRLMRRARNTVAVRAMADRAAGELGGRVYLSHPWGPSIAEGGWGRRRLERRPAVVMKRTIYPESFRVEDELFDALSYSCLGWAAYRIDGPWSPELQGLALIDKGGEFSHTRAQDGWSARPGDGALMRVLEDYPILSFRGLAAQGGDDIAICLRNYDLMQAGWVSYGVLNLTITASTSVVMVEEQGYLSSALFTFGATPGEGGRSRDLGTLPRAAGDLLHVRVVVKNGSVATPETQFLEWRLKRSDPSMGAAETWDNANRVWTTDAVDNPIPSGESFGEVIADAIPCDCPAASADPAYSIYIGHFSGQIANCVFNAGLVDVQHSPAGIGGSYGARTPLVTLDETITREPDKHLLPNTLEAELWSYERGVAVVEIQPFWRAEAMPTNTVKPLLHAHHAVDTWDAVQFVARTGSDDIVRFERAVAGQATFQLDCPIPSLDLNRSHVLRVWARWLGTEGWGEYGPWSVELGWAAFLEETGALVGSGSVLGRFAYEGAVSAREWLRIGSDPTDRYADAYIRTWETRRNPISGLEATWRV